MYISYINIKYDINKEQLPPAAFHLPPATCHLTPTTCHLSLTITSCHMPHTTCHMPSDTYHLPSATCHMPPATYCEVINGCHERKVSPLPPLQGFVEKLLSILLDGKWQHGILACHGASSCLHLMLSALQVVCT